MRNQGLDQFQVISDPSRRRILSLLSEKSRSINSLAKNFDMSRPAVSKHIKQLDEAGFISIETIGRERFCILKQEGFEEIREWISYYDKYWVNKMKKLEQVMNRSGNSHGKQTAKRKK